MPRLPASESNLSLKEYWFQSPFGGLDRLNFDPDPEASTAKRKEDLRRRGKNPASLPPSQSLDRSVREAWMRTWLQSVYKNSNFNFAGAYLKGPGPVDLVTSASHSEARGWTLNWDKIQQDGWMIWPIYQGFSNSPNQPAVWPADPVNWERTKIDRGIAAGKHIKSLVSQLPGDNAGIIVYIDNEEGPMTKGVRLHRNPRKNEPTNQVYHEQSRDLLPYYRALFEEMQSDRQDNLNPVRAGLYIRSGFIQQITAMFPDIYLWFIETQEGVLPDVKQPGARDTPERRAQGYAYSTPITRSQAAEGFKSQAFEIRRYPIPFVGIPYLSIGRQCTLVGETSGYSDSDVVGQVNGVRSTIEQWDFDVSFVPDPRYAQADSHFLITSTGTIIHSVYSKPQTSIREAGSQIWPIPISNAEPGAPLALLDQELYTIDSSSRLIVSRKDETTRGALSGRNPWTNQELVTSENLDLRRLRSLAVVAVSITESLIFYISKQNKIQVYRRIYRSGDDINKPLPWKPAGIWEVGALHPFTNMTTVTFRRMTCLFFMQVSASPPESDVKKPSPTCEATLSVAVWGKPGSSQLGTALKGTAITTVATANHLFVFVVGIGHDLLWSYAILDPKANSLVWSPLKAFTIALPIVLLHPHTRLSACASSPTVVKVAGMSHSGIPSVFEFLFVPSSGSPTPVSQWTASGCRMYKRNVTDEGKGSVRGFMLAKGWTFNVYGDIALVLREGITMLFCAAATAGKSGVMMRRLFDNTKGNEVPLNEAWLRIKEE